MTDISKISHYYSNRQPSTISTHASCKCLSSSGSVLLTDWRAIAANTNDVSVQYLVRKNQSCMRAVMINNQ